MSLYRPYVLLLLVVLCTLVIPVSVLAGEVPSGRKVFILHSYERDHICGGPQHDGIIRGLAENGFTEGINLQVQFFAMDTKRTYNTPVLIRQQAEKAMQAIQAFHPDVLVVLDDNAFSSVALKLVDSDMPIVFSGMNVRPENYSAMVPWLEMRKHPGHNITGVIEKLHILTALNVQKKILKKLDTIFVVSDNSPTGVAIIEQFRDEMAAETNDFIWHTLITDSWEEYRSKVVAACSDPQIDTLYPVALLLKDKAGKTYTAPEILRWTAKHCRKPSIPVNYSFVELGVMGGVGVDFESMGWQAGKMAARILHGEAAGSIPIEQAERYALVFNLARARELGITIPDDILLAADHVLSE